MTKEEFNLEEAMKEQIESFEIFEEEFKLPKLNHKCKFCDNDIFISQRFITRPKPFHFDCFIKRLKEEEDNFSEMLRSLLLEEGFLNDRTDKGINQIIENKKCVLGKLTGDLK